MGQPREADDVLLLPVSQHFTIQTKMDSGRIESMLAYISTSLTQGIFFAHKGQNKN